MNTEIEVNSSFLENVNLKSNQCILKLIGPIDMKSSMIFCENLLKLDKRNLDFIPVLIQSDGGDVDALIHILATMQQCKSPIATINLAQCQSAAAVIFAFGSNGYRIAGPDSYFLFHEYSFGVEGKGSDIDAIQKHAKKLDQSINKKIETHIGLKPGFFESLGSVDAYFTAHQAKQHNIVNKIGFPTIRFAINLQTSIEVRPPKRQEISNPEDRPYKYRKFLTEPIVNAILEEDEDE